MEQIPQYIEDWITIIEEMNNDNTYKLAWGRAIIECAMTRKFKETPGVWKYPFLILAII